ncbi:hypothetical protein [Symbiopectobacterium sp. RP]|uniref:hypothetical protein n=1 Tax=Symbiopectobacterium sp. RP TaxID=3248553 RepID=UPI003D2DDC99
MLAGEKLGWMKMKIRVSSLLGFAGAALLPSLAMVADTPAIDKADNAFMMICIAKRLNFDYII